MDTPVITDEIMEDASIPMDDNGIIKKGLKYDTSALDEKDENDFTTYGAMWNEVVRAILVKLLMDESFFRRVVKDFAKNDYATSKSGKKVFTSLAAGLAVYGKLTEPQVNLAMKLFREHPRVLFEYYHEDVGIIRDDKGNYSIAPF